MFSWRRAISGTSAFIVLQIKYFLIFFVLFVYTVFPFFHEFEEIPLNPAYNSLHDDIPRNGTLQGINFFDSEEFLGSLHKSHITWKNSSNNENIILFSLNATDIRRFAPFDVLFLKFSGRLVPHWLQRPLKICFSNLATANWIHLLYDEVIV